MTAISFHFLFLLIIFYFSPPQWLIGGALSRGAAALLYDGDPFYPRVSHLWEIARAAEVDVYSRKLRAMVALYCKCTGRRVLRICAEADAYSEKMLVLVTLYSDCTGALSFENVCGGGGFRYLGPLAGVV